MTHYSVQTKDWIFVKDCGFFSFAKSMCKNIGKNISKNLIAKYRQKLLDRAKQSATDALKISSKRVIQFVIKLLIKLQKSQKLLNRITQKQLQMNMKKKYLMTDTYLQKKKIKLLMIRD